MGDWQAERIGYAHGIPREVRIVTAWDAELVVGLLCASGFLLKMGRSNCLNHPSSTAGGG